METDPRIAHVCAYKAGPSLALCGEPEAQSFFFHPEAALTHVMACKACLEHEDFPLVLLRCAV